jgi:hypothetical protein
MTEEEAWKAEAAAEISRLRAALAAEKEQSEDLRAECEIWHEITNAYLQEREAERKARNGWLEGWG